MFFFFGGWYQEWEVKTSRSMEFELCSLLSRLKQTQTCVGSVCVGGGLRPSGSSSGSRGSVPGIHTCHANDIHLIYIGSYVYKYIGHETANWLGCDGRRSEHCRRCG